VQAAWDKVSLHTEQATHICALEDLSNMPHDLLALDLAAAGIRFIQKAAKLRGSGGCWRSRASSQHARGRLEA
jgi:hypothetical protein